MPGFSYVAIPPGSEDMRQVYFPFPVSQLNDLDFIRALRGELGKEAFAIEGLRSKLLEELATSSTTRSELLRIQGGRKSGRICRRSTMSTLNCSCQWKLSR
ncbi:unnamed protein product [Durusdinium trenchii]|uniref:Uncharacterized protein n=1 Tax=Durusdinium trenchii TaxID=1381693 RepID=A0ABP0SEZ9_9DINO